MAASAIAGASGASAAGVARQWNEATLDAIRIDFPAPTVHARNLFHSSVAMYDAWAAYDPVAVGYLHNEAATAGDVEAARDEAVSYAAYRVLHSRYGLSVNSVTTRAALDDLLAALGFDPGETSTSGGAPSAVGNRCAAAVLAYGVGDGANEANRYRDTTGYQPVNQPLILKLSGWGTGAQPNRWQPLAFDVAMTQNGQVADQVQTFVGPHWGYVFPFALMGAFAQGVYSDFDPGPPPLLGGTGDSAFKQNNLEVIRFSSRLDVTLADSIDLSPGARGNNPLGTNDGVGRATNPATGQPYAANPVNHGDYGRVVAEFWADGPQSETPPGHWNVLANEVADHPDFEKRIGGVGPVVGDLEWEVKLYFALNAAVHDAAVAAWGAKARYDYVRPITSIRHMGGLGQSNDPLAPSYHPDGLPLEAGLVEVVSAGSSAPGQRHAHLAGHVGQVAIRAWTGEPDDPETEAGGVGWILAADWLPYQRDTFVTPAFAGYVSGHSTFSRAAAEVLTALSGSPFFPGGLGEHTVATGGLEFELGPSEPVTLQWATYFDAADEAGISRLYGGIHVAVDDGPGRILGSRIGIAAARRAMRYFDGGILDRFAARIARGGGGAAVTWSPVAGFRYRVQAAGADLVWADVGTAILAMSPREMTLTESTAPTGLRLYRVVREEP